MSEIIDKAVERLSAKMQGADFDGCAKFVVGDEGAMMLTSDGVKPCGEGDAADVTLTADASTFESILEGEADATGAFMSGKLGVDGDMGLAMRLAAALA